MTVNTCIHAYNAVCHECAVVCNCHKAPCLSTRTGDEENIDRFNRRLVKVTKQHSEECRDLLKLMGVPYVEVNITATLEQFLH